LRSDESQRSGFIFYFLIRFNMLLSQLLALLSQTKHLRERVDEFKSIRGTSKLKTLMAGDIKFLETLSNKAENIKPDHIACSNLSYYSSLLYAIEHERDIVSILEPFTLEDKSTLRVDVIAEHGTRWVCNLN
jgi:hypothetical protein